MYQITRNLTRFKVDSTNNKYSDNTASRKIVVAGPCSAESHEQLLATCGALAATGRVDILRAGVWKPRSNPSSFEGAGEVALEWLAEAQRLTGLPVMTEVATAAHTLKVLEHGIRHLWIGARTCSNPFSVQEIADALGTLPEAQRKELTVWIKNPVSADLELWVGAVERVRNAGVERIGLIHRGFAGYPSEEYRNTPLWQVALEARRRMPNLPMLCDPSHICGRREGIAEVAQEAADLGYDGVMIEAHIHPEEALSDSQQQLSPEELNGLLEELVWRSSDSTLGSSNSRLVELRGAIDRLDEEIFSLLAERMNISDQIGLLKRDNNLTILQSERWQNVVAKVVEQSKQSGLGEEFARRILDEIHLESIARQNRIMRK